MAKKRQGDLNGDHPVATEALPPPAEPTPPERDERNLPVHTVRYAAIKGSIWANYGQDGVCRYNVTFCRLYRTTEGGEERWATSYTYGIRDLPLLEKVAAACFAWIAAETANADVPF